MFMHPQQMNIQTCNAACDESRCGAKVHQLAKIENHHEQDQPALFEPLAALARSPQALSGEQDHLVRRDQARHVPGSGAPGQADGRIARIRDRGIDPKAELSLQRLMKKPRDVNGQGAGQNPATGRSPHQRLQEINRPSCVCG